jgi:hypothetical protein
MNSLFYYGIFHSKLALQAPDVLTRQRLLRFPRNGFKTDILIGEHYTRIQGFCMASKYNYLFKH